MSIKEHPPQRNNSDESALHVPVLLNAMLKTMQPKPGEKYLDLTAGYGGHARAFMNKTENYDDSVLVDRDDFAREHLQDLEKKRVRLIGTDFVSAANALIAEHQTFDLIVADFGVSSPQLDRAERGFSFKNSGPLDMRMDRSHDQTAADIVKEATEQELVGILLKYGEEPLKNAKNIAAAIVQNRPIKTTDELAELIKTTIRRPYGKPLKIHPATRTFQALRIALNDELGQIETVLPLLPKLLNKGGRVGIISFHSLEDRLVKRFFKDEENAGFEAELEILTKKPISGTDDVHNPRARSAKLRIAVKK